MTLNRRIELLENRLFPKRLHVYSYQDGESQQEAAKQYCADNGLELERFENGDYGEVLVIHRTIVSPGDVKDSD
jgi:hypothetical protein